MSEWCYTTCPYAQLRIIEAANKGLSPKTTKITVRENFLFYSITDEFLTLSEVFMYLKSNETPASNLTQRESVPLTNHDPRGASAARVKAARDNKHHGQTQEGIRHQASQDAQPKAYLIQTYTGLNSETMDSSVCSPLTMEICTPWIIIVSNILLYYFAYTIWPKKKET